MIVDFITYLRRCTAHSFNTISRLLDHHILIFCTRMASGPYCWPTPVCPEMLHTFHWYAVETSYSVKGTSNLLKHNQSCKVVAGWNATMKFLLVNHFAGSALGLPKLQNAEHLNRRSVLEERITTCTQHLGMSPNLIAVDFWSFGDLPAVVQEQNRIRALGISANV